MEDEVNALEKLLEQMKVSNVALDEPDILILEQQFYVFHLPGGEVIEDNNIVASPCQLFSQVRTDKPCASGDNCPFQLTSFP